jgi:hypothetical protein
MFASGGPFLWKSTRQPIVTLSSTEAEYVALTMAVREGLAIQQLLKELRYQGSDATPLDVAEDNTNTILNAEGQSGMRSVKHLDVRYHFVKQEVEKGTISIRYIPTGENPADGLTKALNIVAFKHYRDSQLGMN